MALALLSLPGCAAHRTDSESAATARWMWCMGLCHQLEVEATGESETESVQGPSESEDGDS